MKDLKAVKLALTTFVLMGFNLAIPSASASSGQPVSTTDSLVQPTQRKAKGQVHRVPVSERTKLSRLASGTNPKTAGAPTVAGGAEVFYTSSYADHITDGDITGGEDPIVRQAAIDALGKMNGTVLAIEPMSGR